MIDAVAAFIAELMLEGAGEVSENRRVPRIVRWVAVIARVVAIGLLGAFLLVGAFALGKQSRLAFWSFLGVALLMIGFAIYDIWRFARLGREEQGKNLGDYLKQNPEVLAEIDTMGREKAKEVKS